MMSESGGAASEGLTTWKSEAHSGFNSMYEVETLDEFYAILKGKGGVAKAEEISFDGWVFQAVDFSPVVPEEWCRYNFKGAHFWGCLFPEESDPARLQKTGAGVVMNPSSVPFKAFRGFMYTVCDLEEDSLDQTIYSWYCNSGSDMLALMAQTMHDYSIKDALYDYLEAKTCVAIMGGHGMKRGSDAYKSITRLSYLLANAGFVVATGGGPGAMEAGNMGAYLRGKTIAEVDEALALIATGNEEYEQEFMNHKSAQLVIDRFGTPTFMPSLGIPTWRYGHEPSNIFATFHAKMFSNAVREDGLIAVANGGIIYTPGSAGTRQEIFQDACKNHYTEKPAPMIFYDEKFWKENRVFELVQHTSQGRPYHDLLLASDDLEEILASLVAHRTKNNLPVVTDKHLRGKFWMSSEEEAPLPVCRSNLTESLRMAESVIAARINEDA
eukprot:TRINITY_DN5857_c0_g1_i1.p1 TRINITY_DN5857_c0_g1~~TRINITY_DN5857_c0_g1_i1.p1  ORF type:complete len:440 (+),score=65.30 TRINITY_DN5857_c0_g1_i1:77-1396(+)